MSRRIALACALTALVTALTAAPASALTITTPVARITATAPIVGQVTNGLQSTVSGAVAGATTAACEVTGNDTICSLTILSYGVATDYKRPDGTHAVKVTGGIVNVPTLVDATEDGFADLTVTVQALSTSNVKLTIERLATAPANFPVSVEALVNDPSSENRLINVGYDTRETTAPKKWTAQASLTTGTTTTVNATITVEQPPASMAVVGGLFNQGANHARLNPKQARLKYTPVPASSAVAFTLAPESTTGTVSAVSPTTAELELLMLDGDDGKHVLGTLDKLNKPVSVLLDKVAGQPHVQLTTQKDVASGTLVYESIVDAAVHERVRVAAGPLPATTDFTQTANGLLVDTSEPIASVAGGVSRADHPIPASYPLESNEASYVHQDTTNEIDSTTFRVAGVQHVSVETTGPQDDRRIAIGARLQSAPLHVLVTNDSGTRYDVDINDVPHNLAVAIAPARKRLLDFCGSASDLADPCSAAAQAQPQGIDEIVLRDSYSAEPLFGRATHLNGVVTGIPSTLGLDVETRAPADDTDPDQNTKVYIDATRAIGQTILRATDGQPAPADPVDNGLVYQDTDSKYAVVAKVDGFRKAHLDTKPKLALELTAAGGHDFSYLIDMKEGGRHIDGELPNRPSTTVVTLATPEGAPTVLTVAGTSANGFPVGTPKLLLNMTQAEALFGEATSLEAAVSDIPPSVELVIDSSKANGNTKVHVDADHAIGQVLLRATDGSPVLPADPSDNGVIYQDQANKPFAVIAKVDGFRQVHLDTKPKLDVKLTAASGHDFSYGIHVPAEDGKPEKDFTGVIEGRPATTEFSFANADGEPMIVEARGKDASGDPAGTGAITLDALHLDDDPDEKIHNVRVALKGLPPILNLVKAPTAPGDDSIDIAVNTIGGPLQEADVKLDNDVLPAEAEIPALPDGGGGAIVFTGGGRFYLHAHVKQLRAVNLVTEPQLHAALDVAQAQDFRVYLNTGMGEDHTVNVHDCDDWEPTHHTPAHVEFHDVKIKQLQPGTEFDFVTGDDGHPDPCERKSWRTIEYQADGRADQIVYDTNVGDMSHLKAVIGQDGANPLQVPHHLKVCQASDDTCFEQINRYKQCTVGGIDYDYCSTYSADTSVYLESFGEKTHVRLDYCALNADVNNYSTCTRPGVTRGVFVDLNFSHVDMGYHYDTGFGFLTVNTQKHTADGSASEGPNLGASGFIRAIDHNSIAEFINLNFGHTDGQSPWNADEVTTFNNSFGVITFAAPLVGTHDGTANCVEPAYGPTWDETDSYFHVILDTAGAEEDWLGDNLTNLLCGLF